MVRQGADSFILFIAFLSTAVGLLNLFPIPVLDGGHLVFYAYEAVAGTPPSEGALRVLMTVGLDPDPGGHGLCDRHRFVLPVNRRAGGLIPRGVVLSDGPIRTPIVHPYLKGPVPKCRNIATFCHLNTFAAGCNRRSGKVTSCNI